MLAKELQVQKYEREELSFLMRMTKTLEDAETRLRGPTGIQKVQSTLTGAGKVLTLN